MDALEKGYSVIKRIGLLIVVALVAVMMLAATAMPSMAAPITCKGSQDVVKQPRGGGFVCQNNGGGTPSGVVETKNPND